jgi:hypothetical protein
MREGEIRTSGGPSPMTSQNTTAAVYKTKKAMNAKSALVRLDLVAPAVVA